MAKPSPVLISAVAYELVGEAVDTAREGAASRSGSPVAHSPSSRATRSSNAWALSTANPAARPRADLRCRSCRVGRDPRDRPA
jgi:hypothetical protein